MLKSVIGFETIAREDHFEIVAEKLVTGPAHHIGKREIVFEGAKRT